MPISFNHQYAASGNAFHFLSADRPLMRSMIEELTLLSDMRTLRENPVSRIAKAIWHELQAAGPIPYWESYPSIFL